MCPGGRHQDREFGYEILPLENDSAGSVTPWTFQTVEEPSIGQCGQTFRSHGRPARIAAESFQTHAITGFDTYISMHTEAGNHGAAGALEGIQAVSVDLISQAHDAMAGIGTYRNSVTYGVGHQGCHAGIVP